MKARIYNYQLGLKEDLKVSSFFNMAGYTFATYKGHSSWNVFECSTGLGCSVCGKTRKEAVTQAMDKLTRFGVKSLKEAIEKALENQKAEGTL